MLLNVYLSRELMMNWDQNVFFFHLGKRESKSAVVW